MNHRGHFVFVKPEERRFVNAELIRRTTFTATEQELKQRIEALRDAGWSQFVIPITPGEEDARSRTGRGSRPRSADRISCISCLFVLAYLVIRSRRYWRETFGRWRTQY